MYIQTRAARIRSLLGFVSVFGLSQVAQVHAQQATQLASGANHNCVRMSDGTARCWGQNTEGQLGDGTNDESAAPVTVQGLSNVTLVSAGDQHTCAVAGAKVYCWGSNAEGQLGNGTTTSSNVPVAVTGITNASAVAASAFHTCALLSDATLRCWGMNLDGQLGDGTTIDRLTPVAVSLSGASRVDAGFSQTCALVASGVRCWGYNDDGQLGTGGTTPSTTPVSVSALSGVTGLGVGWDHGCALLSTGAVKCWGLNFDGQLGDGTTLTRLAPVNATGVANATRISAGYDHSCALISDGSILCWGTNSMGEIGDGSTGGFRSTPVKVAGSFGTILDIGVGHDHTCALQSDGAVWCWGANFASQIGNAFVSDSPYPIRVVNLGPPAVVPSAGSWVLLLLALSLGALAAVGGVVGKRWLSVS